MKNWIVFLHAETAIHAGIGKGNGFVDLPIMRESHNGWPVIFGSAMKGAFRSKAANTAKPKTKQINITFGKEGDEGAGGLIVSDARILALPVRSLNTPSVLVTCPQVLTRLVRDISRLNLLTDEISDLTDVASLSLKTNEVQLLSAANASFKSTSLYLEEFELSITDEAPTNSNVQTFFDKLSDHTPLFLVNNNVFSHICRSAVPITAKIKLKDSTKTNENLWYEESLPPETIFYWPLSTSPIGNNQEHIIEYLDKDLLAPTQYIQIGGNETVGMGWCKMDVFSADIDGDGES